MTSESLNTECILGSFENKYRTKGHCNLKKGLLIPSQVKTQNAVGNVAPSMSSPNTSFVCFPPVTFG